MIAAAPDRVVFNLIADSGASLAGIKNVLLSLTAREIIGCTICLPKNQLLKRARRHSPRDRNQFILDRSQRNNTVSNFQIRTYYIDRVSDWPH